MVASRSLDRGGPSPHVDATGRMQPIRSSVASGAWLPFLDVFPSRQLTSATSMSGMRAKLR